MNEIRICRFPAGSAKVARDLSAVVLSMNHHVLDYVRYTAAPGFSLTVFIRNLAGFPSLTRLPHRFLPAPVIVGDQSRDLRDRQLWPDRPTAFSFDSIQPQRLRGHDVGHAFQRG